MLALFAENAYIEHEGRITRKTGKNALLLCQKITNTTIKEDSV